MKKGLSVLLIAAALFGFYGGATSLTDVLASKAYWEEEGEKSTADMNKLEDGLNQLKDNEQAYLDGQKTLAEGEKTLADGEALYAQKMGEFEAAPAKLADAERQLAEGRAKLNAAEKQLAAAPAQLADAEEQLEEGKSKLDKLALLIAGIDDARSNYAKWKAGYDDLHKNRKALANAVAGNKTALLSIKDKMPDPDAYEAAVNGLTDENQYADGYRDFATNGRYVAACVDGLLSQLKTLSAGADTINSLMPKKLIAALKNDPSLQVLAVKVCMAGGDTQSKAESRLAKALGEDESIATDAAKQIRNKSRDAKADLTPTIATLEGVQSQLTNNLVAFADAVDANIDTLESGQDKLAAGVATIASNVLANKDLKDGVQKNYGQAAIQLLQAYSSASGPLSTKLASFAAFEAQMDSNPGIDAFLLKARNLLAQTRAEGIQTYSAGLAEYEQGKAKYKSGLAEYKQGKATYNAGLAEYRQGLADYAAAPALLADARKQLDDGKKQLEDGKKKLAEYEDGEQQVRDGLATLMATKADPGLESILDRRNGDDKFDDANGHLQLNEGLEAVDVGRGYQADSGDLITKEVTNRAVGTAAGLGAAALAVLAAILSFLKKNKGAAISAVLAAVAGGIGAGVGFSAGEYYSDIAGSTIGNTPFIAAAVLAVVAAVFAIVHFTAKPEAK